MTNGAAFTLAAEARLFERYASLRVYFVFWSLKGLEPVAQPIQEATHSEGFSSVMFRSAASQPAPIQRVRPRIRRLLALTLVAITITAISVSCYAPVLRAFGRALIVNETVYPSDVVAVPQWTGASGVLEAADLIREGL